MARQPAPLPARGGLLLLAGLLALGALAAPAVACVREGGPAPPTATCADGPPYAEVEIDGRPQLALEVARTPEERARGLMFREWLAPDSGMLFQFDRPTRDGFWMRNTLIPLSIAWLDGDGTIVDIQEMQPLSDEVHAPAGAYVSAIEANRGWFEEHGVGVGQRVLVCAGNGPGGDE